MYYGKHYHNYTAAAIGILNNKYYLIHLDFFNEQLRTMNITSEIAELFLCNDFIFLDKNSVYIQFYKNNIFHTVVCDFRQGLIEKECGGFALYNTSYGNIIHYGGVKSVSDKIYGQAMLDKNCYYEEKLSLVNDRTIEIAQCSDDFGIDYLTLSNNHIYYLIIDIKKTIESKLYKYSGKLYKFNILNSDNECLDYDINNIYISDNSVYYFENEVLINITTNERHIINFPKIVNISNGFVILDTETVYDLNNREIIKINILNTVLIDGNIIRLV